MATIEIVRELLSDNLDIDPETVSEDTTLESLNIDSLDMAELVCDLEEKCDIEFGTADGITTVGELVAHIDSLS